jgi:hypothetical protein
MCLVFDFGFRVWAGLGRVEICFRFTLLAAGPLFFGFPPLVHVVLVTHGLGLPTPHG